jgi:hypothetical protein
VDAAPEQQHADHGGRRQQRRNHESARQGAEVERGNRGLWDGDLGCEHV